MSARLAEERAITPEVWDGIRLRHSLVESAGQPTEAARAMAYLSHLDRADLIREVERLKTALAEMKRCTFGGNYGRCTLEAGHDGRHQI